MNARVSGESYDVALVFHDHVDELSEIPIDMGLPKRGGGGIGQEGRGEDVC